MTELPTDDLLAGLKHRDFIVLFMHAVGKNPNAPKNLLLLKRTPLYVRRARDRLTERGLLTKEQGRYLVTDDGKRAARTGAALFELEAFIPTL